MRDDKHDSVPNRTRPLAISPTAGRDDTGDLTRLTLVVDNVIHPFLIKRDTIEAQQTEVDRNMCIGCPAILLPLRTIGRDTVQVTTVSLHRSLPYLIQ